jgi:hypothetical protein
MKNTIFIVLAALVFGTAAQAQSTVDSINAKYQLQVMPQPLNIEKTFPVLGTYQLNTTTTTTTDAPAPQQVVITLDPDNKGIVWIEGLPEGKMKAYLRKAPAIYRIVAQKSESGRQIPEGTLLFDPSSNTLNIALGKAYDDTDPAAIFNINSTVNTDIADAPATVKVKSKNSGVKTKSKVFFYTATKNLSQI